MPLFNWGRYFFVLTWTVCSGVVQAGMFDDNEARLAVLDLRKKVTELTQQVSALQSVLLDQANQMDQMQRDMAMLRGQNESLAHQWTESKHQQNQILDQRLKHDEPKLKTVDPVSETEPDETARFQRARHCFEHNELNCAEIEFRQLMVQYPQSEYQPEAQYGLGNILYVQHKYKEALTVLQEVIEKYPTHLRAPEALLIIAQIQLEHGQNEKARQTLDQIVSQYASSSAAQQAHNQLSVWP